MDGYSYRIATGVAVTEPGRVGTDLDAIIAACKLAIAGDSSRAVSFDAEVVLEIARRLRDLQRPIPSDESSRIRTMIRGLVLGAIRDDLEGGEVLTKEAWEECESDEDRRAARSELLLLAEQIERPAGDQIRSFVSTRLESMASRPRSWAATREVFIVQLALLIEVSWIGRTESLDNFRSMLAITSDLCGAESEYDGAVHLLTLEWARGRVDIARKYLAP